MWQVEDHYHVKIGSNTYIDNKILIAFRGVSLFNLRRHDDGYLGIDFDIYDQAGKRLATVRRNEIYFGDKDAYQIDGSANRYVLTEKATGRIICDIRRREDAQPAELELSVHLYTPSGFLFDATPEQTNLGGMVMRNCVFEGNNIGIAID
jgi:hypothetical protein